MAVGGFAPAPLLPPPALGVAELPPFAGDELVATAIAVVFADILAAPLDGALEGALLGAASNGGGDPADGEADGDPPADGEADAVALPPDPPDPPATAGLAPPVRVTLPSLKPSCLWMAAIND